jgi:hypothetical protein
MTDTNPGSGATFPATSQPSSRGTTTTSGDGCGELHRVLRLSQAGFEVLTMECITKDFHQEWQATPEYGPKLMDFLEKIAHL